MSRTELFSPAVFRIFWSGGGGGRGVQAGAPQAILCPATQGRRPGYPAETESDIGGLKKMPFLDDLGYQGLKGTQA